MQVQITSLLQQSVSTARELTQALEEATQLAGGLGDVQVKLHGEEGQGLRTQRHHQHLVLGHVTLLEQ